MKRSPIICLLFGFLIVINTAWHATAQAPPAVNVRLVTDEAEAVLGIQHRALALKAHGTQSDGKWLF